MTAQNRPDELIRILRAEFVTKGGGVPGALCVAFTCGATGWRASGGTIDRTLVHETAFQLDAGGDARGAYAVDLQHDRVAAAEVAGADYSMIQGEDNRIDAGADYSFAQGVDNQIGAGGYACLSIGIVNEIDIAAGFGGQYLVYLFGESHNIDEGNYIFFGGSDIDVIDEAFGAYAFGEQIVFEATSGSDYPTYTGAFAAILSSQKGNVWSSLQVGESNEIENDSLRVIQSGYRHYSENIIGALQVGAETLAYDHDALGLLDAQILLGDGVNDGFAADPWQGMNQSAWLSQAGWVTTWNVAWTTEWEFPLRQDMVWYFKAIIVGTESGAANSYCWILEGLIENDGGTTTILAFTATNNYYRDVATKEWQVVADDPNDRYALQFRDTAGPDATACNLQLNMMMAEVGND